MEGKYKTSRIVAELERSECGELRLRRGSAISVQGNSKISMTILETTLQPQKLIHSPSVRMVNDQEE